MKHGIEVCEFGRVHGQCRCDELKKPVSQIECDLVDDHRPVLEMAGPLGIVEGPRG